MMTIVSQVEFDKLVKLMRDKGVIHEAFEILADIRRSEKIKDTEATAVKHSVIVALGSSPDYEDLPPSDINYLQCIRRLVKDEAE